MRYAISVWRPSLQQGYVFHFYMQRIQNMGIHLSCSLQKYDHVSSHWLGLRWLSVQNLIKQSTLSSMYCQHHYQSCLKLNPPIQFGCGHSYSTGTNRHFASILRFSPAFGKNSFQYKDITWWNALSPDLYQVSNHNAFMQCFQKCLLSRVG